MMIEALAIEAFVFSEGFDRLFLEELYAGDTLMIEQMFETSLTQVSLSMDLAGIESRSSDPARLRRVIHHAKPLFGYMGLLSVQDSVQQFEDLCQRESDMSVIRNAFEALKSIVEEALIRVRHEQSRLHHFNQQLA